MSKMKLAGTTPLCVECNKFYSLKKMTMEQDLVAHETGLCPKCQEKPELLAKHTPVVEPVLIEAKPAIKPAVAMRNAFATVSNDSQAVALLTDKEFCLKQFGLKYAFLKEINADADVKEQLQVGNKARYGAKLVEVSGVMYAITNDLYEKNVERFVEWTASLNMKAVA